MFNGIIFEMFRSYSAVDDKEIIIKSSNTGAVAIKTSHHKLAAEEIKENALTWIKSHSSPTVLTMFQLLIKHHKMYVFILIYHRHPF